MDARLTGGLMLVLLSSCEKQECDRVTMMEAVYHELAADGRKREEYIEPVVKRDDNLLYVGLGQKLAPTYMRHYWIDPETCEIIDVRIDQ